MSTRRPATLQRASTLAAPADVVWRAVHEPATLVHVAAPLLRMPDLERRTRPWRPGESVTTRLLLCGLLPLYRHTVVIELLDEDRRTAQTRERGGRIAVWRHRITVEPIEGTTCRYTDDVELEAGRVTVIAHVLARVFYRWRHARWRRLAPVLAATAGS